MTELAKGPRAAPPPGRPRAHPQRVPAAVPQQGIHPHPASTSLRGRQAPSATPTNTSPARTTQSPVPARVALPLPVPASRPAPTFTPREQLLAAFDIHLLPLHRRRRRSTRPPGAPHPSTHATTTEEPSPRGSPTPARERQGLRLRALSAWRTAPALLIDGAAGPSRVLNADAYAHRRRHRRYIIDNAIPRSPAITGNREVASTWHCALPGWTALPVARHLARTHLART